MPPRVRPEDARALAALWDREASGVPGEVSVHLRSRDGAVASRRAGSPHYAASTVKLAVLVAALAEAAADRLALAQELEVRAAFPSAVGGSFRLRQADDQDDATWLCLGGGLPVGTLLERMVVESSNVATNLIVERIGLDQVRQAMAAVCAEDMTMNRLIGDKRAEAAGVTNSVTAWGLARLLGALAAGALLPASATQQALDLLARQRHRRMIPAGLPAGAWSASKGGWTAAVNHDVALVRPERAPAYVLAVCTTTGLDEAAERLVARLSAVTWEHWMRWHMS
jgi:beta-lactamase class A